MPALSVLEAEPAASFVGPTVNENVVLFFKTIKASSRQQQQEGIPSMASSEGRTLCECTGEVQGVRDELLGPCTFLPPASLF